MDGIVCAASIDNDDFPCGRIERLQMSQRLHERFRFVEGWDNNRNLHHRDHMKRNNLEFYELSASEWWEESAQIYALKQLNPPRFSDFDRDSFNWQNLPVLDVGCGGRFSCEFTATCDAIVSGSDPAIACIEQAIACIEQAKRHAKQQSLTINDAQGLAVALPFSNQQFDCVMCMDVLEVDNLNQTLQEIHRVLKLGGLFWFDLINQTIQSKLMIWLLEDILQAISRSIHDWQKFMPPKVLTTQLQQLGFTQIGIQEFNLFGQSIRDDWQAYWRYQPTQQFCVTIGDDRSLMYISKAVWGV